MEVVNVVVTDSPEVVAVNVAVGFGMVVNSDATYSATVNSGDTLVVPDSEITNSEATVLTSLPATIDFEVPDSVVSNRGDSYVVNLPATKDLKIPDSKITNSEGTVVQFLPATLPYVLPDSWAHSSDWSFFVKVPSTQSVEFPDTPIKNTLGTTILTQPSGTEGVIADSVVTNSDNTFSMNVPAETNPVLADVTHIDSDLTPVVLPAMTPMVCTPAATPEGWYPPADWGWDAASALINDGDNGFVAIVAVFSNITHRFAFTPAFSGTATVDWGDGTSPEALTSTVKAQHEFDYANIPGSVTSCGFKCAVVKIVSSSYFKGVNFDVYHSSELSTSYNGMVALKMRATYDGSTLLNYTNQVRNRDLFLVDADVNHLGLSYCFYNHVSLKKLILPQHPIYGLGAILCGAAIPFVDWNSFDWSNITSLHMAFTRSNGYPYSLNISIPKVTSLLSAFGNGSSFRSVTLTNTGLVTSIGYAVYESITCKIFSMDDCALVTDTAYFIYTGANYIENLILTGLTVGINISNGKMSATALNAFFTALGTAAGSQTITVTGNPGAATCDTTIATAKGFTVVT